MSGVTFPLCPPRLALIIAGGDGKTMCVKLKYICKHVVIKSLFVCLFCFSLRSIRANMEDV